MSPSTLVRFLLNPDWRRAAINLYPAIVRLLGRGAAGGPWADACLTGVILPMADRSPASRLDIVGEATGMLDALEPLSVRGLSLERMLIESPNPLEVGSIHEFRLVQGTTSVEVRAAVRQVSPLRQPSAEGYFLVDLEFLDLDTRSSLALEAWLNGTPARRQQRRILR
jgi:hypothetical protein